MYSNEYIYIVQLVGETSMLNILTQLLNGQVKPFEEIGKNSDEIKELEKFIEQNFKELNNELNTKQKEILEKYSECVEEYFNFLIEDSFCVGLGISFTTVSSFIEVFLLNKLKSFARIDSFICMFIFSFF